MTKKIYPFNTKENPLLTEVGGKALSLISTTKVGLPVPEGLALSVAFFTTVKLKPPHQPNIFLFPGEVLRNPLLPNH